MTTVRRENVKPSFAQITRGFAPSRCARPSRIEELSRLCSRTRDGPSRFADPNRGTASSRRIQCLWMTVDMWTRLWALSRNRIQALRTHRSASDPYVPATNRASVKGSLRSQAESRRSAFRPYWMPPLSPVCKARVLPGAMPAVVPHTAVARSGSPQRVAFGLVTGS